MALLAPGTSAVTMSAQARAAASPQRVFDTVVPVDLPRIMHRFGPLPGVAEVRDQSGPWDAAGRTRTIVLSDGSTNRETLTEYIAGSLIAYELDELTGLLAKLVHGVRGQWDFTPDGSGSIVRWTWELVPLPARGPLLRVGFAPVWRQNMQRVVRRCAALADAAR